VSSDITHASSQEERIGIGSTLKRLRYEFEKVSREKVPKRSATADSID
jgi:hypothetical protein